jgi:hypothetical protein
MGFCQHILILVKFRQRSWHFRWRHTYTYVIGLYNGHTRLCAVEAVVNLEMSSADCLLCEGCIEVKEAVNLKIKWNTAVSEVLSEGTKTVVHINAGIRHEQFVPLVEIRRNLDFLFCEGRIEVKEAVNLKIKLNTAVSDVLSEGIKTVVHINAGIRHE